MFLDIIYFLVRYAPFWSVPVMMITGQYAYNNFHISTRLARKIALACIVLCFFSFTVLAFYVWAGGPIRAVYYLDRAMGIR